MLRRLLWIFLFTGWTEAVKNEHVYMECSNNEMKLSLNTEYPFYGRIYSPSSPSSGCQVAGVGGRETHLILPLRGSDCGVLKLDEESYVAVVTIQHHPLVQQHGDRALRLVCNLGITNYTVTSGFNSVVEANGRSNEVVDSTSPSPHIRLRILSGDGNDVTDARLGEKLILRVEMDGNSVFSLAPKGLIASSGRSGEHVELLDEDGCPTENGMFPQLRTLPHSKLLQGEFKAFKFSDDVIVRFHMNVQFCATQCPIVDCQKVKEARQITRRDVWPTGNKFSAVDRDPFLPLQKEIIVEGAQSSAHSLAYAMDDDEMLCVRKGVFIGVVVVLVIVQICILLTSVMCIWAAKKYKGQEGQDDGDSLHSDHMLIEPQNGDTIFYTDNTNGTGSRTRM